MQKDIEVPEIGENVTSGVVVAVHVKVGDRVAVDDTVIELETDKALVEIPSPFDGKVTEVLAEAGNQMNVGDVIARVETEAEAPADENAAPDLESAPGGEGAGEAAESTSDQETQSDAASEKADAPEAEAASKAESPEEDVDSAGRPAPAAPSIRRLARELGVYIHEVQGSGPGGRISEADVKAHVRERLAQTSRSPRAVPSASTPEMPDFSRWGAVDIQALTTVRRLTAQSTAASWAAIPHVTQFDEADVTDVMAFIEKKGRAARKAGAKITITAILVRVAALALKRFPQFNASIDVDKQHIIYKKYVHVGIAADTPRGLLVPVIRDADQMTIIELAQAVADLAERAREKKIQPAELEGGTFTLSNQGGIGGIGFTPLVLWPQVAILGVSRSRLRPVYLEDGWTSRSILPLSLSYDHRIIDGADAARFLRWTVDGLEQPLNLFLE